MDERTVDLRKNDFWINLQKVFIRIYKKSIYEIIDVNPGKTSLSSLLNFFPNTRIDAYMYPWNKRKKEDLQIYVKSHRYSIISDDVYKSTITKKYDLLLACNYFSEAFKIKYEFIPLVDHLLTIRSKYFCLLDTIDNPLINYDYILKRFVDSRYRLIAYEIFERQNVFALNEDESNKYVLFLFERLGPMQK